MSVLTYDWIYSLTEIQKNYFHTNYHSIWDYYVTFGYEMTALQFSDQLMDIYNKLKSVKLVEPLPLPKDIAEAVRVLSEVRQATGNLRQVVTAVPNYHMILLSVDEKLAVELQKCVKDIPVVLRSALTDEIARSDCNCVVIDDVSKQWPQSMYTRLELGCIPYIRRSVLNWYTPDVTLDVENVIARFVQRNRPCRFIR